VSIVQIHAFRPNPSHSATDSQSFRFSVKIFSWSALDGGQKKYFHRGPNPLSAALEIRDEAVVANFKVLFCMGWEKHDSFNKFD
jgi:hypothetical protein